LRAARVKQDSVGRLGTGWPPAKLVSQRSECLVLGWGKANSRGGQRTCIPPQGPVHIVQLIVGRPNGLSPQQGRQMRRRVGRAPEDSEAPGLLMNVPIPVNEELSMSSGVFAVQFHNSRLHLLTRHLQVGVRLLSAVHFLDHGIRSRGITALS